MTLYVEDIRKSWIGMGEVREFLLLIMTVKVEVYQNEEQGALKKKSKHGSHCNSRTNHRMFKELSNLLKIFWLQFSNKLNKVFLVHVLHGEFRVFIRVRKQQCQKNFSVDICSYSLVAGTCFCACLWKWASKIWSYGNFIVLAPQDFAF